MEKKQHFTKTQGVKKDIERCFDVLQARFAIIQSLCRLWQMDTIYEVIVANVIFHNNDN